jgi:glycosidase
MAYKTPDWTKSSNIYEVNIRQFTKEGTINAFREHLKRLKDMGVDILWLMPVFPIGVKNRKGTLGSAYSVMDYKEINPDYGTKKDFAELVGESHSLGMHVILDWVANHTAWDNPWIVSNPDRYYRDSYGNILAPNDDWTDVAHLNYDNPDTVKAMIDALSYWVKEFDIDGYRCDMAGLVPTRFWVEARKAVDSIKPCFWLAEWEDPKIHEAFDMTYCWELHNLMKQIAGKRKNVYDFDHYRNYELNCFKPENYRLTFTTNHDESAWNGTEFDRFGSGAELFAVLNYLLPGMPLIYSGQESAFNKTLPLFEKVEIEWGDYSLTNFYKRLNALKTNHKALWNGVHGGSFSKIMTTDNCNVYVFARIKDGDKVIGIFNASGDRRECIAESELLVGNYVDWFTDARCTFTDREKLGLKPWEYKILVGI